MLKASRLLSMEALHLSTMEIFGRLGDGGSGSIEVLT